MSDEIFVESWNSVKGIRKRILCSKVGSNRQGTANFLTSEDILGMNVRQVLVRVRFGANKIHDNILPELFMDGSMTSIDLPSQSHCYSLGL